MLRPEQLYIIPQSMVELFRQFEDYILADISRRIAKVGKVTETARMQAIAFAELLGAQQYVLEQIETLNADALKQSLETLVQATDWAEANDGEVLGYIGFKPATLKDNAYLRQLLDAASIQTSGELLNITQSMGFKFPTSNIGIMQSYQRTMDSAVLEIASGAVDYNTAIKKAVKSLADSGIRHIDYANNYTNHADVAARRAIMTGVTQLSHNISEMNAFTLGTDYFEVSAHAGARPSHAEWQGKQYKKNGSAPGYPNLVEATGYGTGEGLGGWNCRHDMFPIIPGLSTPMYSKKQLKELEGKPFKFEGVVYTLYQATQQQRKLEDAIRKAKRQIVVYDAAGLEDDAKIVKTKQRQIQSKYREFSKAAGLRTQSNRTMVA